MFVRRFKAPFEGSIYVYGRHKDCVLYSSPAGLAASTKVLIRIIKNTCPDNSQLPTSEQPGFNGAVSTLKPQRLMVQFDRYLVAKEDFNFLVDCQEHGEKSGTSGSSVRFTVLDDNPVILTVRLAKMNFELWLV